MKSVFTVHEFQFPYTELKFPGQASDEKILYVGREASVMLWRRMLGLGFGIAFFLLLISTVPSTIGGINQRVVTSASAVSGLIGVIIFLVIGWWTYTLWLKSIFIVTNRRLTKYIYVTPWNRYNLSVGLDKIVDTGAYAKGYFQAWARIGTFTARSSAGNRQEKYFYVENIHAFEDLANYVNKLLFAYNKNFDKLDTFRPFLPFLKGQARKRFMEKYPQYWS